jgi:hypothetical protein
MIPSARTYLSYRGGASGAVVSDVTAAEQTNVRARPVPARPVRNVEDALETVAERVVPRR